ncbi:hypothetical protein [Rhizobium leguminosarum]|uniref:hypothetical protein n=1 Tax=Rhizobium leguminosarum TaxID=384 RepID=UPI00103EEA7E|nr:hypothetical protein [Rhizobium leguminosarum]TCA21435.1 hypothetical protein E0H67_19665 [Rhizobium leguminosarum bv. viciae]
MTDWNAYFDDLINRDHARERFEERYQQCTEEVKAGIEVLRQVEANVATVQLLAGKYETRYSVIFTKNSARLDFIWKRRYPFHLPTYLATFIFTVDKGGLHHMESTDNYVPMTVETATQTALDKLKDII